MAAALFCKIPRPIAFIRRQNMARVLALCDILLCRNGAFHKRMGSIRCLGRKTAAKGHRCAGEYRDFLKEEIDKGFAQVLRHREK